MKTILFFMVPHASHIYGSFGLANYLKTKGHKIVYCASSDLANIVIKENYHFEEIEYIEEYCIENFKIGIGLFTMSLFSKSFLKVRYKSIIKKVLALESVLKSVKPDIIFLDHTLSHYFIHLKNKANVIQLSTSLSHYRKTGIPPLNVYWCPKNNFSDKLIADLYWSKHLVYRKFSKFIEKIIFIGKTDEVIFNKLAKNKTFLLKKELDENASFYSIIKNIPTIVTPPSEIEFSWYKQSINEFNLPLKAIKNEKQLITDEFKTILNICSKKKINDNTKIVYVALGTLSNNDYEKSKNLLLNIIKAGKFLKNVIFIISTNGINIPSEENSNNIYLFEKVPQLTILSICDLMINHCGTGSIKECIEANVPMICFPLNRRVDHLGNSSRIVSNQIGLRHKDSPSKKRIYDMIIEVLYNPLYKENVSMLNRKWSSRINDNYIDHILKQVGFF